MAATVTVKTTGRIGTFVGLTAIKVTVDANSVSYATSLGGLAIDLFNALSVAGTPSVVPNGLDIIGILPLTVTAPGFFLPTNLQVGTITSTTIPCYVKLAATGSANSVGLGEIADGVCTQTFTAYVLMARGGQN